MNRKGILGAIALFVFGATHQVVTTKAPQTSPGQLSPVISSEAATLCSALQDSLGEDRKAGADSEDCPHGRYRILFVLATVPNPANSQLALSFDRSIEAIQRAAGDRGFLYDRFVFPWDAEPNKQSDPEKRRGEEKRRRDSESRPGMLLFRPQGPQDKLLRRYDALAVLLTPENPSSGINEHAFEAAAGFARRNASSAEAFLVLGPNFSSSAVSLRRAMDETGLHYRIRTGSATVPEAWHEFHRYDFRATVRNDGQASAALEQHLMNSPEWAKQGRIAFLAESGTLYGANAASAGAGQITITFPRGISWLRNAYQDMPNPVTAAVPALPGQSSRLLPFEIAEPFYGDDKPPTLSSGQTPISNEEALLTIATTLRRERVRFVVITGTDPLDNIFLMKFLHDYCPDIRLFTSEADLLYIRAASEFPLSGAVVVTTYPLFTRNQYWTRPGSADNRVPFDSMAGEGTYNALRSLLAEAYAGVPDDQDPDGGQRKPEDVFLDYRSPFPDNDRRPPVWLVAVTRNGYAPLAVLTDRDFADQASTKQEGVEQTNSGDLLQKWPLISSPDPASGAPVSEGASHLWFGLALPLLAACLAALISLSGRFGCERVPVMCAFAPERERHADSLGCVFYRSALTLSLALMAAVLAGPILKLPGNGGFDLSHAAAGTVLVCGMITAFAPALKGYPPEPHKLILQHKKMYRALTGIAFAAALASAGLWIGVINGGSHHEGFFAAYRSQDLEGGLAPSVPYLLLVLAFGCWAWVSLKRLHLVRQPAAPLPSLGQRILDASDEQALDQRVHSLANTLSRPFVFRGQWLAAAIAPPVFYFVLRQYTQSLELWQFDVLYAWTLSVLITLLTGNSLRLILVWRQFRQCLGILEMHPAATAFARLSLGNEWGPILNRGIAVHTLSQRMARLAEEIRRDLKSWIPNWPTDDLDAAQAVRELYLDPQWQGKLMRGAAFDKVEEWWALHFVAFFQTVCRQMENLLVFLTVGFVLTLLSLSSYPFQAGRVLGWIMAGLLVVLGGGIVAVLAGAERNPILSRLNGTTPGEIGKSFYLNLLSYGALPILMVLAAGFPSIGQFLFSWVQPALQAMKS